MKYVITKNITCTDKKLCHDRITKLFELKTGARLEARSDIDTVQGHVSINHEPNNHKIWCFVYDNTGDHECENAGIDVITKSDRVVAHSAVRPSLAVMKEGL